MGMEARSDELPVQYRVSFRDIERHLIEVEVTFATEGKEQIDLMMPVWTPGSYLVREYARQVEEIRAEDASSTSPLTIRKTSKNTWTVDCKNAQSIRVRYSLYCREMSVRTNWIERDFGFLTGAATFLTRADWLKHPHIVRLDLPPQWPDVATSLPRLEPNETSVRKAKNFDELVDGPIVMGKLQDYVFQVGGKPHHLVTVLGDGTWDSKKAAEDITKIIETEQKFWGEIPYDEYWFLNIASESGGGLEHDNSCVLMTGRWTMRKKSSYTDWLALVSHEFFHAWNVRRLRPKVLVEYDYTREQYFPELWIAEGITSYYDELFVAKSGFLGRDEYLGRLSKGISGVQNSPGRLVQPLWDSSWDSWIKHYRPDENAGNSRISYYSKGAIVGMLLDAEIQSRTGGTRGLRDVMQRLWKEHRQSGYTLDDFQRISSEVAGVSMDEWFKSHVWQATEVDYSKMLEWYGLRFKSSEAKKNGDASKADPAKADGANAKSESPSDKKVDKPVETGNAWLGCVTSGQDGRLVVRQVPRGTPADLAGLNVDDELIAIEDHRLSTTGLDDRLSYFSDGDTVRMTIARRSES